MDAISTYNNISRFEIKQLTVAKTKTSQNITRMLNTADDRKQAVNLLGDLILIKYNRQTGIFNNTDNPVKQEECWQRIENTLNANQHSKKTMD